jgi:hypothetical protein
MTPTGVGTVIDAADVGFRDRLDLMLVLGTVSVTGI